MKLSLPLLFAVATFAAGVPATVAPAEGEACEPYPIGRCGAYDREVVIFCWLPGYPSGTYVSGTDASAITLHVGGVRPVAEQAAVPARDILHVRSAPAMTFANDVWESDLPFGSLWLEANSAPGLQLRATKCGQFIWYAECDSWMGPYGTFNAAPDKLLA